RILAARKPQPAALADLFALATSGRSADTGTARQVLGVLAAKVSNGEIAAEQVKWLRERLLPVLVKQMGKDRPLRVEAALLAATFRDDGGLAATRELLAAGQPEAIRVRALEALASVRDPGVLDSAGTLLGPGMSVQARGQVLAALGRLEDVRVAAFVLGRYAKMEPDLKPRAVELLTQRPAWGKALLRAVADKKIPPGVLNVNQARRLLDSKDAELVTLVPKD